MNIKTLVNAIATVENSTDSAIVKVYGQLVGFDLTERGAVATLAKETGLNRKTLDYWTIQARAWNSADSQDVSAVQFRKELTAEIKRIGTKDTVAIIDGWRTFSGCTLSGLLETLAEVETEQTERDSELEIFLKHLKAGKFDDQLEYLQGEVWDYCQAMLNA
jgi:transposase-like protein